MMDFRKVRDVFLTNDVIESYADQLRKIHFDFPPPIDVELIAEKMGIDLWPIPSLKYLTQLEACVSNNAKVIFYDDRAYECRLRFSIAHEIGHIQMHSTILEMMRPSSYEDWHKTLEEFPSTKLNKLETQANIFAGRLLIPTSYLIASFGLLKDKLIIMQDFIHDPSITFGYIAKDLAREFDVSEEAMLIRLKYAELNPFDFI